MADEAFWEGIYKQHWKVGLLDLPESKMRVDEFTQFFLLDVFASSPAFFSSVIAFPSISYPASWQVLYHHPFP